MQTPIEKYIAKIEEMKTDLVAYSKSLGDSQSCNASNRRKNMLKKRVYNQALFDVQELLPEMAKEVEKESIERAIEVVEKQRKTGIHEFDLGYRVCRWCGEQKTGVYTVRENLIVDEKSGGSSVEATDYAYDITGHPCKKNTEPKVNKAIDDILSALKTLLH